MPKKEQTLWHYHLFLFLTFCSPWPSHPFATQLFRLLPMQAALFLLKQPEPTFMFANRPAYKQISGSRRASLNGRHVKSTIPKHDCWSAGRRSILMGEAGTPLKFPNHCDQNHAQKRALWLRIFYDSPAKPATQSDLIRIFHQAKTWPGTAGTPAGPTRWE